MCSTSGIAVRARHDARVIHAIPKICFVRIVVGVAGRMPVPRTARTCWGDVPLDRRARAHPSHRHTTLIPERSARPKGVQAKCTSPPSKRGDTPAVEASGTKRSSTPPGGVMVDAVLNRRLTVPLTLDTGAELTVLTKQAAEELGIPSLDQLPIRQFGTAGGMVNGPIASLRSLRVGTAEARDVIVGIDMDGRMPVGLLGKSFLRHFKVTVDQPQGQVTFER